RIRLRRQLVALASSGVWVARLRLRWRERRTRQRCLKGLGRWQAQALEAERLARPTRAELQPVVDSYLGSRLRRPVRELALPAALRLQGAAARAQVAQAARVVVLAHRVVLVELRPAGPRPHRRRPARVSHR